MTKAVFGQELNTELYGTQEDRGRSGLRQRLAHGESLRESDTRNYVIQINNYVLGYFNTHVIGANVLNLNIVNPHRHFFGNRDEWKGFIRSVGGSLDLKSVLAAHGADENNPTGYQIVAPEDIPVDY